MTEFLNGISNFFARHRAHCAEHETYQRDCAACVAANGSADPGTGGVTDTSSGGFFVDSSSGGDSLSTGDMSSTGDSCSTSDTGSNTDSCSTDSSDFGGFDGGDSGGGGASGDF